MERSSQTPDYEMGRATYYDTLQIMSNALMYQLLGEPYNNH